MGEFRKITPDIWILVEGCMQWQLFLFNDEDIKRVTEIDGEYVSEDMKDVARSALQGKSLDRAELFSAEHPEKPERKMLFLLGKKNGSFFGYAVGDDDWAETLRLLRLLGEKKRKWSWRDSDPMIFLIAAVTTIALGGIIYFGLRRGLPPEPMTWNRAALLIAYPVAVISLFLVVPWYLQRRRVAGVKAALATLTPV